MKCPNCGFEREESFSFCPNCGNAVEETAKSAAPVLPVVNPVAQRVLAMFNNPLYLVICILSSAAAVFNICNKNLPLLGILTTIFMWLIFSKARKGIADHGNMRCVSGTIFAQYVVIWVATGILVALGGLCCLVLAGLSAGDYMYSVYNYVYDYAGSYADTIISLLSVSAVFFAILIVIIAAVVVVFNVLGIRSIHRFAKSLYESTASGNLAIVKRGAAQGWLMAFGILSAVGAVGTAFKSGVSFLASGCTAAAYIIGSVLVGKFFSDCR